LTGELVLIVEDDERSRRLLRDVLQHDGYRTLDAATAVDALVQAREGLPSLVIMDIQLPDGDGVATLGELRRDPKTSSIPAIAVTAFAMKSDEERFLAAGFDGYITKPIDLAALRALVKRLTGGALD
jgi:two-component system cell cycle response regulator DivK